MNLEDMQLAARGAYVECALWSSTDESDESGGEPLDANYSADDIAAATLATMHEECDQFIAAYWALIVESGQSPEQCGCDFWLTRNGHGAGFWDRGYPARIGDALTQAAKTEGARDLYVGDDGLIYQV